MSAVVDSAFVRYTYAQIIARGNSVEIMDFLTFFIDAKTEHEMNFTSRRKFKYYGWIFLIGLVILVSSISFIRFYETISARYAQQTQLLKSSELSALNIQYSFKKQVQEWKNILIRGAEKAQYDKYHTSFMNEFENTQTHTQALIGFFKVENEITEIATEFQNKHRAILAEYLDALFIYNTSNFDIIAADKVVKGIDREPNELLNRISIYVQSDIRTKRNKISHELLVFKTSLAFTFIFLQLLLFFVLIRLTKRLLTATLNDKTTGLGNRELFVNSIDDYSKNLDKSLVAMLDIDEFKIINETCGNLGGDAYLHQIGKLVIAILPEKSEVCRISSDVFGFVLPSTTDNLGLLENLRKQIASFEFHWQDLSTKLTSSIGAYELNADTPNETVLNALYASLQEAKSTGRNKVVFYNEKDDFIVGRQKQMRMVSHVSEALAKRKIVLFKQAIMPVNSDKGNTYFEVLMRVKHEGVYYSPFPYLQAAERFHLITQVDRYIVTQTALYLQSTPSNKANYSVNLSGQTLSDPSLPAFFERLFARIEITPNQLGFEITETDVIRNFKVALINVKYLRSKGCKISLDDFGTGMSSYAYLSELNIDTLKIDGTFIQNIDQDRQKQAIVESIILLSNKLQLTTVAEFVENESEFNRLESCKIDYCQGYFLHKPELFYEPIGD